jgi:osmotically-inducible protein OsmY
MSHFMFNQKEGVTADLRADIANALHWDLAIPRYRVTAEVDHGLVTLQGVVERAYQRSYAEAIVLRVPGVIGVKNEIAVCAVQKFSQPTVPT